MVGQGEVVTLTAASAARFAVPSMSASSAPSCMDALAVRDRLAVASAADRDALNVFLLAGMLQSNREGLGSTKLWRL